MLSVNSSNITLINNKMEYSKAQSSGGKIYIQ